VTGYRVEKLLELETLLAKAAVIALRMLTNS